MKYSLILREEAEKELIEAGIYYEEQQLGLGSRFIRYVENYFEKILRNPDSYEEKSPPNREAYIQKFPFIIVYQVKEDKVIVLSVFNAYQDPEKKFRNI